VSVYLSVSPPDGFTKWGEPEWDRWLRDHPWESAERICSRGDWAIFLYQIRAHAERARKLLEPHLEALVNERALDTMACDDLGIALQTARDELAQKPAAALMQHNNNFASVEDLESMIFAAQERLGRLPSAADVWEDVFEGVVKVLADAQKAGRGIYFGNL
jgi:hypothetical protein